MPFPDFAPPDEPQRKPKFPRRKSDSLLLKVHIRPAPVKPLPIRPNPSTRLLELAFLHACLSFTFLALLPQRPLSIPTALGLAFAAVYYLQLIRIRKRRARDG